MTSTREKLIELIQAAVDGCARYWAGRIADHLVTNGVTVQGWISVENRLPDGMDDVLVWYEYRAYNGSGGLSKRKIKEYGIGCYIPRMGVWGKDPSIATDTRVIAWMPLPEPPERGENNG